MHVTAHNNITVAVSRRHRVVVAPVAHERQRGDTRRQLLAGVVGRWKRLRKGCQIALKSVANCLVVAAQAIPQALSAAVEKMDVEGFEALEHRDRHQEVAPRPTSPSTLPLSLPLPGRPNRSS